MTFPTRNGVSDCSWIVATIPINALVSTGADETKAREAAMSVVCYDTDIGEIKASLLLLKWMVGFTLAFVVALTWRVFQ